MGRFRSRNVFIYVVVIQPNRRTVVYFRQHSRPLFHSSYIPRAQKLSACNFRHTAQPTHGPSLTVLKYVTVNVIVWYIAELDHGGGTSATLVCLKLKLL